MSTGQVGTDFRVHTGFFAHRKTLRLERRAGPAGVLALLRLWAYAATNHPDGNLGEIDPDTLADMAGWRDDPGVLFDALSDADFIDVSPPVDDGRSAPDPSRIRVGSESEAKRSPGRIRVGVRLHDWDAHQPYLARREERKEASKRANQVRWTRRKSLRHKGSSESDPSRIRTGSKAESPSSSPPPLGGGKSADAAAGVLDAPPRAAHAHRNGSDVVAPMLTPPKPIPGARVANPRSA